MQAVTNGTTDLRIQRLRRAKKGTLKRTDNTEPVANQRFGDMQAAISALLTSHGIEMPQCDVFFEVRLLVPCLIFA